MRKVEDKNKTASDMNGKRELLGSGAEAVIFRRDGGKGPIVIKERIRKNYRHEKIDLQLRRFRTRREAKVLAKLKESKIPVPSVIRMDDKAMILEMEFMPGSKLRDVLETEDYVSLCREIGRLIGMMHSSAVIHGDLTTSNMILLDALDTAKNESGYAGRISFIDFGLSFFSHKIEDMAVDLHLLRQALESKHYTVWEECFSCVIVGYKKGMTMHDPDDIISRLEKVEKRGRNKDKF